MGAPSLPHDTAYKAMFSFPDMVKSLLLDFVPYEFVKHFDFATLKPSSASFVTPEYRELHDDIVWEVCWNDRPSYLCLIFEFQSTVDYWMGVRITTYTSILWKNLIDRKELKIGEKLPPVFPVVLYNGQRHWNAPTNVLGLVDMRHPKLMPHQPSQEYVVIDEKRIPKHLVEKAKGNAAYVIRGEIADTGKEIIEIGKEFIDRNSDPNNANLRRTMIDWLAMRMSKVEPGWASSSEKENPEMLKELLKEVEKVENKYRAREKMVIEESEARGEAKVISLQRNSLLEMLNVRFGSIPERWQKAIDKLNDPEKMSTLTISVLKAQSPDEYEELLNEIGTL